MALKKIAPNKWLVKVSIWDKNKGYPVSKQATVTGSRADAVTVEVDFLKELKARSLTSAHASTFGEAVVLYMDNLRLRGRLSAQHETTIGYIRRELGHVRLEVFADQFEVWRKYLITKPTRGGKLRKGSSVNRYTAIVRAAFERLVELEVIGKNPITAVRFPKFKEKARDRYLTQEERLRLFNAIREHRPYILPIVQFMVAVPCRKSELVGARREQYNPFTTPPTIYIPDSKAGIPIHKPVPPEMVEYFRSIPDGCPWLFFQETAPGKYRPLTHLRYAWRYCLRAAGIADCRIHDLRHIAATDLVRAGNPTRTIMDVAGWKTDMLSAYWHTDSLRSAQGMVFQQPEKAVTPDFIRAVS